ncbi:MAG TPA: 50S ribosomal protein L28 [Thermoflexia bacterium]|nr:50S ribosomal protein L28 [Thermoflexia bacterium]
MAKCDICGKSTRFGRNVSHSKKSTNRRFMANIQRKRVMLDGRMQRIHICTQCLRTLTKQPTR